jgi:hypothetical protein
VLDRNIFTMVGEAMRTIDVSISVGPKYEKR